MKLRFFHPVHGRVSYLHPKDGKRIKSIKIDSNDNHEVEIPFKGFTPGTWNIIFDWEQNKEQFTLSKEVVIE